MCPDLKGATLSGMTTLVVGMPGGFEFIILLVILVPLALIVAAAVKYLHKK